MDTGERAKVEGAEGAGSIRVAGTVDHMRPVEPGYMIVQDYVAWAIVVVDFGCGTECLV